MKPRFKKGVVKQVALWGDVVDAMDGKPYGGLMSLTDLSSSDIWRAQQKGHFSGDHAFRIYLATCGRVELTAYGDIKSSNQKASEKAWDDERIRTNT